MFTAVNIVGNARSGHQVHSCELDATPLPENAQSVLRLTDRRPNVQLLVTQCTGLIQTGEPPCPFPKYPPGKLTSTRINERLAKSPLRRKPCHVRANVGNATSASKHVLDRIVRQTNINATAEHEQRSMGNLHHHHHRGCRETGPIGICMAFSPIAVGSRCPMIRTADGNPVLDAKGARCGENYAMVGNKLRALAMLDAMEDAWLQTANAEHLEDRLVQCVEAGKAAGGERARHHPSGLLVHGKDAFARTDLRIDRHQGAEGRGSVGGLRELYDAYRPLIPYCLERVKNTLLPPSTG